MLSVRRLIHGHRLMCHARDQHGWTLFTDGGASSARPRRARIAFLGARTHTANRPAHLRLRGRREELTATGVAGPTRFSRTTTRRDRCDAGAARAVPAGAVGRGGRWVRRHRRGAVRGRHAHHGLPDKRSIARLAVESVISRLRGAGTAPAGAGAVVNSPRTSPDGAGDHRGATVSPRWFAWVWWIRSAGGSSSAVYGAPCARPVAGPGCAGEVRERRPRARCRRRGCRRRCIPRPQPPWTRDRRRTGR